MSSENWTAIGSLCVAAIAVIASAITAYASMRRQSEDLRAQLDSQADQRKLDRLWETRRITYTDLLSWMHGDLLDRVRRMASGDLGDGPPTDLMPAEIKGRLILVASEEVILKWNSLSGVIREIYSVVEKERTPVTSAGVGNDARGDEWAVVRRAARSTRLVGEVFYGGEWRSLENALRNDAEVPPLWSLA